MKTNLPINTADDLANNSSDTQAGMPGLMFLIASALMILIAIGFMGCADGGVYATGYGASFYTPDYGPYYGEYLYGGDPWWGPGPIYNTDIIINGGHHRLYYGGHHFVHDFGGGFGGGFHGGGFRGGGGRGR